MATTRTRNIKLYLSSGLSSEAKANLEILDSLGAVYSVDASQTVILRSAENIELRPNSASAGGSGVGGNVVLGNASQPATLVSVFATTLAVTGNLSVSGSLDFEGDLTTAGELKLSNGTNTVSLVAPSSLGVSYSLTLPEDNGNPNQVLTTDGSGILSWTTPSSGGGGSGGRDLIDTWTSGTSITVTHNWGTRYIQVEVLDNSDNFRTVYVDVTRPTSNTVELTSSVAPSGTWTILLKELV